MTFPRAFANFFALSSEDDGVLDAAEARIRSDGSFDAIWRPNRWWVVATRQLGSCIPDDAVVRKHHLVFSEGREAVLDGGAREDRCLQLVDTVTHTPQTLARWSGDFSFLHFMDEGSVVAVRSCAGWVPVYFWRSGDRLAVSSQIDSMIGLAGWRGAFQPLTTASWIAAFPTSLTHDTHLAGVRSLAVGEWIKLHFRNGGQPHRYWMPLPDKLSVPSPDAAREHQARLRALLLDRLATDLDPAGHNLLAFSGGVDSSALLALATRTLRANVMTWSALPPLGSATRQREMGFVEPLRKWAGVSRYWEREVTPEVVDELSGSVPYVTFPVLHPVLGNLAGVLKEAKVTVLLGGEFADEVCGSRFTLPDWCAATTPWRLATSMAQWPLGFSDVLRWLKQRAKYLVGKPYLVHPSHPPAFCPAAVQEAYADFLRDTMRWASALPVFHRHLFTRHVTIDFAAMNWEACSALGVRRSTPFLTREVIELAVECHPSELVGPGTKRLLRGALKYDVPHHNLYRADKGDFGIPLDDATVDPAPLSLTNDRYWEPLDAIVSPTWRRNIAAQGKISYIDRLSLLRLRTLNDRLLRVTAA